MEKAFVFKKKWGQNFLSDPNLLAAIVADAGVGGGDTVLEIGAGAGSLTAALAEKAGRVVAYEIDRTLSPVLDRALAPYSNAEIVYGDFLKADLPALEKKLGRYRVVANLPYYITTPTVLRFIEEAQTCVSVTVMVQAEVAERFCARAGTPEYGAVTAAIARKGTAAITRRVPAAMFRPRPNVDSAVVNVDFAVGGFAVNSERAYRETVRCAFSSRRKTLENNLISSFHLTRGEAKELLQAAEIENGARGETLPPERFGRLSDLLLERGVIR